MTDLNLVLQSVLRVGDGRGFVVQGVRERYIITAAHCLPFQPPAMSFSHLDERMYENLCAPIGSEPTVSVECLFVDPIGDIAVLGPPDEQAFPDANEQYYSLVDGTAALDIADPPNTGDAWLLSLDKRWFGCSVRHAGGPLWITRASQAIEGGMSGSPIISDGGVAIGIVCTNAQAPTATLTGNLPGWLLNEFKRPNA